MRHTVLTTAVVLVLLVAFVAAGFAAQCAKCGANLAADAKFCPNCGEKVAAPGLCPQCGTKVPEGAKFCPNCGAKIGQADAGAPAQPPQADPGGAVARPRSRQRIQDVFTTALFIYSFLPDGMTQGSAAGNAWQRKFLQTAKACGFNAIAGSIPPQMLDMAEEMNLYVLYDTEQDIRAALDKHGLDAAGCHKALESLGAVCRQHRNVLAGFMITDPAKPEWKDNWRLLGSTWSATQPDVPLLAAFTPTQWQSFDAAAPVNAVTGWAYVFKVGTYPDLLPSPVCFGPRCSAIRQADPRVPVLSWINTWGPVDGVRWPTMAEFQALHWALLAEGARGGIYWGYQKPDKPGDPPLNLADTNTEPRPIIFDLKPMIQGFARIGAELLNYAIDDTLVKSADGPVEASIYVNKTNPKKRYLVLANRDLKQAQATTVTFDPGGHPAKQLRDFADGSVVPVHEQGGLIVCVVRLEPASGRMLEIVGS